MYCSKDAGCCNLCHSEEMLWPSAAGWRDRREVSSLTGMAVPKGRQREQAASASATDETRQRRQRDNERKTSIAFEGGNDGDGKKDYYNENGNNCGNSQGIST